MPAKKHPDYKEELERLDYTLGYVEKSIEAMIQGKERIDNEVAKSRRHFDSANSQSYIDLMINTMFQSRMELRLKNLLSSRGKPYFARIDFREENKNKPEKLYIGKLSLIRDEDQELIIVDWRAPVANLYYESKLGEASYTAPDGNIKGELSLKRQFTINNGELEEIFDIDITTNDEFLQSFLGANADNRLKDIASTIQIEQNKVIRADMWRPLIVQGAAGSGKTTIALHRIAYLIYTFEKTFTPENFMIIAPNRLFLNYISEVLPELGVDRVKQTTFEDFAMELIGKKFKLRDENEKLILFTNHNISEEELKKSRLLRLGSELKASMVFKQVLDEYMDIIENSFIPKEDFKIDSFVVYKYEEIRDLFLNQYKDLPMLKRMEEIKKHLANRLKVKKDLIINALQGECDIKVQNIKSEMENNEERQRIIAEIIDKKDEKVKSIQTISKKAVKEYIDKILKTSPYDYYKKLISDEMLFSMLLSGKADEEVARFIRQYSEDILNKGFIEIEDLAPIIYIKYRIYGMDEKIPVKHIVIDEAQDFSVFQFYVIKKIVKDSSFTILGDINQGIHSYRGTKDWGSVKKYAFEDYRAQILTLEQSYRTTIEIMDAANGVISKIKDGGIVLANPVVRHGQKPEIIKKQNMKEISEDINIKIKETLNEGFKTIAIVCKTMDECVKINSYMKKYNHKIGIVTGKEKEYKGGIVIVPSYLAKGLEFDVVIISNANEDEYREDELDIKLLYVAMTRPLHRLYIYYHGRISPLLL